MRDWIDVQFASKSGPFDGQKLKRATVGKWLTKIDEWAVPCGPETPKLTGDAVHRLSPVGLLECVKPGVSLDIPAPFEALAGTVEASKRVPSPMPALRRHATVHVVARHARRQGTRGPVRVRRPARAPSKRRCPVRAASGCGRASSRSTRSR